MGSTHGVQRFLDGARYAGCGAQELEFVAIVGHEGDVLGGLVFCHRRSMWIQVLGGERGRVQMDREVGCGGVKRSRVKIAGNAWLPTSRCHVFSRSTF